MSHEYGKLTPGYEHRQQRSISELASVLEAAQKTYEVSRERSQAASREATSALNALNTAQKAFTSAVEKLRAEAPRDSDWGSVKPERVIG